MESDHGFAEKYSTANASSEAVNHDSIEIPDGSDPIDQFENDD